MATKLKNLKIRKVDFVDEGANPDANIGIVKRKDGGGEPGKISMNQDAQGSGNADTEAEKVEFTKEQTANQMRMHEEDFLQGLIDASRML